jgi:hypothetical protein
MDELFGSGMKLAYLPIYSSVFEYGDETELSNVIRNKVDCPSFNVCVEWAAYYKNVSVFMSDFFFETFSDNGGFVGSNREPLICRIDDGVFSNPQSVMILFYGEPLMKRLNDIFGRVVEAGLYNYWISQFVDDFSISYQHIAIVNPLDEYCSFNLYHMQPAFYLLLMGLCLSVICFVIELLCYRLFDKRGKVY